MCVRTPTSDSDWLGRVRIRFDARSVIQKGGQGGIEPPTSPTLRENHATRPLALQHVRLHLGSNQGPIG